MPSLQSLIVALTAVLGVVESATLQFSWGKPKVAFPLPQDLVGFSIEADRWPEWAGNVSSKNTFTYNLLKNLKLRQGVAPRIRVGGGSQEGIISVPNITGDPGYYGVYDGVPWYTVKNTRQLFPQAYFTGAGYHYWLCSGNLPEGTKFTWGINLAAGNVTEAIAQIRQIERAFADPHCKDVKLDNIDIGNEPDQWAGSNRGANWTIWEYKDQLVEYYKTITTALGNNGRKFRVADFALPDWTTEHLLATGIMRSEMGSSINAVSEHHYQSLKSYSKPELGESLWPWISEGLINKDSIRNNLTRYGVSALQAKKAGTEFFLGETNTYFGHGQPGVSDRAATALWMIDYSLQAASIGITGLHFHQGVGYNYSAWIPVDHIGINITDFNPEAKRHVRAPYYGFVAVADAIGTSGNAYVNELWTGNNTLAAYQIWEGCKLKRIMLINENPWTEVMTGPRPVMSVTIPGLAGRSGIKYKRLAFPTISERKDITWGGQSWDNYNGTTTGTETFENLDSGGSILMDASSAALIYV